MSFFFSCVNNRVIGMEKNELGLIRIGVELREYNEVRENYGS